jgi:putative hydrolase of the HAD superfamily
MRVQAILFDLDDTLIERRDSFPRYATYFQETFGERLRSMDTDELADAIRRADAGGYRKEEEKFIEMLDVLPWQSKPAMEELFAHWNEFLPLSSVPRHGLFPMLDQLRDRGIRMGIITNGRSDRQHAKLNRLDGLRDYMDTILVSGEVGIHKPDPQIFHKALADLHVTPEQAWYVGDHPVNDILGASGAGLTAVWRRGCHVWPSDQPEPHWQFDTLDEIVPMLERFEAESK